MAVFYRRLGAVRVSIWIAMFLAVAALLAIAPQALAAGPLNGQGDADQSVTDPLGAFMPYAISLEGVNLRNNSDVAVGMTGDTTINKCESKTYTYSILNHGTVPITSLVATASLANLTGFDYVTNTASLAIDSTPICTANPQLVGTELIWDLDVACSGTYTLGVGETLDVSFDLETDCTAVSGSLNGTIAYQRGLTLVSDDTAVMTIEALPGAINIRKTPSFAPGGFGDIVTFTIEVENTGLGVIENVEVTDEINVGLTYPWASEDGIVAGQTQTWSPSEIAALASMNPGDILTWDVGVEVVACENLNTWADATWGCGPGTTCYDTSVDGGTAAAAVQRIARTPNLSYNPPDVTFNYCDPNQWITYTVTNYGDGTAHQIWLHTTITDFVISNVSTGATYNSGEQRFELDDPILTGESYQLSFQVSRSNWCEAFDERKVIWQTEYLDDCDELFYPPSHLSKIKPPSITPSVTAWLSSVPGILQYGAQLSYTVRSEYSGPDECGSGTVGPVTVTSTVPVSWTVASVGGGGLWTPGSDGTGGTVVWTYIPTATLDTYVQLDPPATSDCETYCGGSVLHQLVAVGEDCCGCVRSENDAARTYLECEEGVDSHKTATSPVERCDAVTYTNTYTFPGDSTVLLSDLFFTEMANNAQEFITGTLSINLTGSGDITSIPTVSNTTTDENGVLELDFSSGPASGLAGQTLTIVYDLRITEETASACWDRTIVSWSRMDLGATSPGGCLEDGVIHEATMVRIDAPEMELALSGVEEVMALCESATISMTLEQISWTANPRDVELRLSGLNYYVVNPAATICSGDVSPVSCTPTLVGDDYVWTFGDAFTGAGQEAVFQIEVRKRCTGGGKLTATATYDDQCNDDATPDQVCSTSATDQAELIVSGDLLIEVTPEEYLADTNQATWKVYVTNRGSGDAHSVWIDYAMGSGLDYNSVTPNDATGVISNDDQDHDGSAINGGTTLVDKIAAGTRREFTVLADLIDCDNLTLDVESSFGCDGDDCATPVSDNSSVTVPSPLLVTTNAVVTPVDACATTTGYIILRNAGPVTDYNLEATVSLPVGLAYASGTTRWRVDGGAWNGPNASYDPNPTASPLAYTSSEISALASLASGSQIEIEYDLTAECTFVGGEVRVSTNYESPCGQVFSTADSAYTVLINEPDVNVTVTRADEPVGCNELVSWDVTITNNSGFDLPVVQVQNVFSSAWTYAPGNTAWQASYAGIASDVSGQTVTWELTNLSNGASAQLTIEATSDSAPCSDETGHEVLVRTGCGLVDGDPATVPGTGAESDACLHETVWSDLHESTREPDLTFASISISPTNIDACNDATEVTLVIENTGPVDAQNLDVVITLPDGLSYNNGIQPQFGVGADASSAVMAPVAHPSLSGTNGATLTWYDTASTGDNLLNSLQAAGGNDTMVLKFSVSSACYEPGNLGITLYHYDCCGDTQYSASDTFAMAALYPQLAITKAPLTQQVDCGELVTWTITVTNTGNGAADVVYVEDTLGAWFDYVSSTPSATDMGSGVYAWELLNYSASESREIEIVARLSPDADNDCDVALRQNTARTHWACGTGDGNPATTGEYSCSDGDWVTATATKVEMPNLRVRDIESIITCESDGVFSGSVRVRVQNLGDGNALSPFTVEITDGKGWTGWVTPTVQNAGVSTWYDVNVATWLPDCHDCSVPYVFSATVDTLNDICECDETNNTRTENYTAPIPELAVDDIDFSQVSCSSDELGGAVRVVVSNTACVDATDVRVRLVSDGCLIFSDQFITITQEATAVASFPVSNWADCLDNTCVFTATVDPDGETCECDGTNQTLSENWSAEQPDLVVTAIDTNGLVCENDGVSGAITVTIQNQGFGTPTGIPVRLNTDGCLTFSDQTVSGPLANGATGQAVFTLNGGWSNCADVSCALTAIVDPNNTICECDGTNNSLGGVLNSSLPNLYVESVTPLIVCDSDGPKTVNIDVVVGNEGVGDVNGAVVQLVSTCGQTFVNQTVNLASGITQTLTFGSASSIAQCSCTYIATIDPANVVCECANGDNTVVSEAYSSPAAELTVSDIGFSNLSCSSDTISGHVRVQVQNSGCAAANNVPVRLSTDGCLAFSDQTITSLAAGGSTWVTFNVGGAWTDCTDEGCKFTATVDPLNAICEFDGTNNTRTETYNTTLPDLVVSGVDATGIVCEGDTITGFVTVTVANQGYGSATGFEVALVTDGCLTFGNQMVSETLGNGQSAEVGFSVSGWADCAATSCVMTATVDATDSICECDGTNNTDEVTYYPATIDLVANSVTPNSTCASDSISGTVTVNVSNGGSATATNAVVRLTSDCGQSFGDKTVTLSAGANQDLTFYWTPVTDTCACTFTAEIDPDSAICECNGTNNSAVSAIHTTDTSELTVEDLDFSALICASDNLTGTVGVTVRNSGCYTATMVRVRLATDGCMTFDDRVVSMLGDGQSTTVQFPVADGWADCTDESCQFTATVDPDNAICEYDGTNNDRAETWNTTLPDLVVSSIDTTGIVCSGDVITGSVSVMVTNQGYGTATGFEVALATDGCLSFDNETVSATLGNGQSTEVGFDVSGWADCAATTCAITATVDVNNAVCECDGDNNQTQVQHTSSTVDLTVDSVTPSSSCNSDVPLGTVVVNVGNGGTATASNAVVRLTSDCGVSFQDQTVTLAASASQNVTFTYTPLASNCACTFTAEIDPDDAICECDGTNNSATSVSHTPEIPDLRVASDTITINCERDGALTVGGSIVVANDGCGAAFTADIPVRVTLYDEADCAGDPLAQWTATLTPVNIASHSSQSLMLPNETLAVSEQAQGCAMSVEVELDPEDLICEYSGANNSYCANKANPLPDLEIAQQSVTVACVGDASALLSTSPLVSNTGCAPVNGPAIIFYTLYNDADCAGSVLGQWTRTAVLNLAAGSSQWLTVADEPLTGNLCDLAVNCELSLRAEIDVTDQVCEISGDNNAHCENVGVDFPDLLVSEVAYDSASPGELQVVVGNQGCADATGIVVTVTSDCGPIIQPQTISLTQGEVRTLTFRFDPPTCDNCECIFVAMIDGISQICECDETNNVRNSNQEPLSTELSMSKTTSRRNVYVGEVIDYTIIVSNTGDATAGGVVISDELSSGLEFVGPVVLDGSLGVVAQTAEDMPVVASGVTIKPHKRVTVTLPVRVTGLGPIRNVAVAGSPTGSAPPTEDDEEILALAIPTHMTGCLDPFCPGWTLRYSFWITNTLPETLNDIVVWDDLPAEVCCPTDVSWNSVPFELSEGDRKVTWRIDSMEAGEVVRLGVGLHSYPNLAHGTVVSNTIRYYAERLGEERSESIELHADTTICGEPEPTPQPLPSPTTEPGSGDVPLWIPLVLKD